jgi:hypothetical protein
MNLRTTGFIAISIATVAVWFTMAPPPVDAEAGTNGLSARNYADLVDQALSDGNLNESRAESAPQQQVVNGWIARDLLSIIALAQADTLERLGGLSDHNETVVSAVATRDDRIPALLGLAVLALCWGGALPAQATERVSAPTLMSHMTGEER